MKGKTNSHKPDTYVPSEVLTVNVLSSDGHLPEDFEVTISKITNYTTLEYIESTGTQYIDTGFKPNQDTRIVARLTCPVVSSTTWALGARLEYGTQMFGFVANASKNYLTQYGTESYNVDTSYNTSDPFMLEKNKASTYINGTLITTASAQTFTCPVNLTLCAMNNNGTINYGKIKLYSCQIYDNDILIRDYIPAKNSEGIAGLYDKVNDKFYTSASSKNFVAGPIQAYTQLEYIESTGAQYIDTGFKPNQNTRIITEAEFLKDSTTATYLYGVRTASSSNLYAFYQNKTYYRTGYATTYQNFASSLNFTEKFKIDKNKNVTTLNDTTAKTNTAADFSCEYNLCLFALSTKGTISANCVAKLYSMQIYDNDVLIRDYVPAKDQYGICGLYDKVNKTFSPSNTTTQFVEGPSLNQLVGEVPTMQVLHTQTVPSASYRIPLDTTYIITANNVLNYITPKSQTYTANQLKRNVDIIYNIRDFGVFVMDSQGNLVQPSLWTSAEGVTGVALITDTTEFVIAPEEWRTTDGSDYDGAWNGNDKSAWGGYGKVVTGIKTTTSQPDALIDFAGSSNTDAIISQLSGTTDEYSQYYTGSPIAEYCRAYSKGCKSAGQWYLPSAGEMSQLGINKSAINEALNTISGDDAAVYMWTSTQYSANEAWGYYSDLNDVYKADKYDGHTSVYFGARPICKIEDTTGNIITFKIGSTSYLGENQMNWAQWVNSKYNIDGYKIVDGFLHSRTGLPIKHPKNVLVHHKAILIPSYSYILPSVTVTLNSQWQVSTKANPDASLYDIYESFSNKGVASKAAIMYIDIVGLSEFTCYIRSYGESSSDYVMIGQLDKSVSNSTDYSNTTYVKASTYGKPKSGTALSQYTKVTYTDIDGGSHRIRVVYRKDASVNSGDDRGYLLVPKL